MANVKRESDALAILDSLRLRTGQMLTINIVARLVRRVPNSAFRRDLARARELANEAGEAISFAAYSASMQCYVICHMHTGAATRLSTPGLIKYSRDWWTRTSHLDQQARYTEANTADPSEREHAKALAESAEAALTHKVSADALEALVNRFMP